MPYTLTVNFNLASPDPGSYRVKFWPAGDPGNITTRIVSNSPFVEGNLPATDYAGTIESSCGGGTYSSPVSFTASIPTITRYLIAEEYVASPGLNSIKWLLSTSAGATSGNTTLPFGIKVAYYAYGTGIGPGGGTPSPILVSGLELAAGSQEVIQGTTASTWTNVDTVSIANSNGTSYGSYTTVISPTGSSINQPYDVIWTFGGTTTRYRISILRNSFALI